MSEFQEYVKAVLETATKFKKVMQNKNIKLAKTPCPHCKNGFLHGRLNPPKNHLWMKCDNCSVMMME